MALHEVVALVPLTVGIFFSVMGIVGLIRLPDVYTRLHASGKVSTLGIVGLLICCALILPNTTLKVVALAIFLVISAPVASHAIAAAAHRLGVPRVHAGRDDLIGHMQDDSENNTL